MTGILPPEFALFRFDGNGIWRREKLLKHEKLAFANPGCAMEATAGQIIHLADYRPTDFVLERVDLTFELDPKETLVIQRSLMHRREGVSESLPLILDGDELTLKAVAIDGNAIDESQYAVDSRQLV